MKSTRLTLVVLIVAVTAALFVSGCTSQPSTTTANVQAEQTTTTAAALNTYTDPDYGFSFRYPADWGVETTNSSADVAAGASAVKDVTVYDPKGATIDSYPVNLLQIAVYKMRTTVEKAGMDAVKAEIQSLLKDIESQDPSWSPFEELTETEVGGIPGFKVTYDFSFGDTPARTLFCFLFYKDTEFQLVFQTVKQDWESYKEEFAAIADSFALVSSSQ